MPLNPNQIFLVGETRIGFPEVGKYHCGHCKLLVPVVIIQNHALVICRECLNDFFDRANDINTHEG